MATMTETVALDRTDLDLYGETVMVEFVEHIRPTVKFDSVEALLEAMDGDVRRAREVLFSAIVPPAPPTGTSTH